MQNATMPMRGTMMDGIYPGIINEVYQRDPAVSKSRLVDFDKLPARVIMMRDKEETVPQALGSLFHTAALEPQEVDARYHFVDLDRRGTKAWDAEEARAAGRTIVKVKDVERVYRMRDALLAHPTAKYLVQDRPKNLVESSWWWTDPLTGLQCRCRPDLYVPALDTMVDLKSCENAGLIGFARNAADFRYDWQVVHYLSGARALGHNPSFVFIAIEKEEPHQIGLYEISRDDLSRAELEYGDAMQRYLECVERGVWPGYSDQIETLILPPWTANNRKGSFA
jgi:exodeoxyribonuclease VIII